MATQTVTISGGSSWTEITAAAAPGIFFITPHDNLLWAVSTTTPVAGVIGHTWKSGTNTRLELTAGEKLYTRTNDQSVGGYNLTLTEE